jgi:hypothetical protein
MRLNCKQGDLAVIVRSHAHNEGKIVECVRLIPAPFWAIENGPRWIISTPVVDSRGHLIDSIADKCLRPLRDSGGLDEMLRLVGLPADKTIA